MQFSFRLALIGALTAAFPFTARGQGPGPRITGLSIERFYEGSSYFTAFMYHRTDLPERAAATGIDVALGMVPVALAIPSLQLQVDAGVAGGLPVGPVTLLLRGGATNFVRLFPANDISLGFQGGVAAIIPLQKRARIRVDLTRHHYIAGEHTAVWSVGVGFAEVSP
jgi:hypothetical protein